MKKGTIIAIVAVLAAIVLFLLLICYLSVTRQIKADNEVQQQEQAAEQQMEEQFINMSEEHATDSIQ